VELLPAVLRLVTDAEKAILEVYASGPEVEYKSDDSPITRADRAAHEILVAGLTRLTPGIPVLSEESTAQHAREVRGGWREFWLVDPLDGTREFISRNGEFTVNVALIRDHRPVLGVVGAPVLGVTYYGAVGHGAFKLQAGRPAERIHVRPAADPLVVVGSRSHRGDSLDGVLAKLGAHELRPMGRGLLPATRSDVGVGHGRGAGRGRGSGRRGHDAGRPAAALQRARHAAQPAFRRGRRHEPRLGRALLSPPWN
jgi:3'(2'), 5'-bisphosphate nucleotidase